MAKYKVDRTNISYNSYKRSMICDFTITNIETQEKHYYKNIYLSEDNKDAFLVFPTTNEEVYINRNNMSVNFNQEESEPIFDAKLIVFDN